MINQNNEREICTHEARSSTTPACAPESPNRLTFPHSGEAVKSVKGEKSKLGVGEAGAKGNCPRKFPRRSREAEASRTGAEASWPE